MKNIKKALVIATFCGLLLPSFSYAQTTAEINAQLVESLRTVISLLQQQVAALVEQLRVAKLQEKSTITDEQIVHDQTTFQNSVADVKQQTDRIEQVVTNDTPNSGFGSVPEITQTNTQTQTTQTAPAVHKLVVEPYPIKMQGSVEAPIYGFRVKYPKLGAIITISTNNEGKFHSYTGGGVPIYTKVNNGIIMTTCRGSCGTMTPSWESPNVWTGFDASSSPVTFTITAPDDSITVTTQ